MRQEERLTGGDIFEDNGLGEEKETDSIASGNSRASSQQSIRSKSKYSNSRFVAPRPKSQQLRRNPTKPPSEVAEPKKSRPSSSKK
jgi:hypothetical protein